MATVHEIITRLDLIEQRLSRLENKGLPEGVSFIPPTASRAETEIKQATQKDKSAK